MQVKQPEIVIEMNRLIDAAQARNIQLRAIGGLAVQTHNKGGHAVFIREYPDLDFVVSRKQRHEFEVFMDDAGFEPDKRFNLLNGSRRQIYHDKGTGLRIDVFVGDFEMCHRIPLEDRLHLDPITIPLTELFLSKAQIVELNRKDALDIASLLLYNETGHDDNKKINLDHIAQLCCIDWGLYKTTSMNLKRVADLLADSTLTLTKEERDLILSRVNAIQKTFDEMPKSVPWQIRDKVGTRVRWYEEVEEVRR
jgi:hypothetical protein